MAEQDVLYLGATIHTMTGQFAPAEALLVRDGRIAAVGRRDEVELVAGTGAARIDLGGLTIVPGFHDSHCHVLWIGMQLLSVDVSRDAVHTIEEIQQAVRARAETTPESDWILGNGYDQNALVERRHPTRVDLDAVTQRHPAVLHHTSGHVLTCNTQALRAAGITRDTPTPEGGEIDRDADGEPTGVLKESAMALIADALPAPTLDEGTHAILEATRHMAALGITSATDLNTGDAPDYHPQFEMYRRAFLSGEQQTRLGLCPNVRHVAPPGGGPARSPGEFDLGLDPHWLAVQAVKIFSDGALSTRTAAMREGYAGEPDNRGILIWPRDTLADMITRAHLAGWQIATHALGDRAVEVALGCYAQALSAHPRSDHRHRIEHLMVLDRKMVAEFGRLGVVPVMQPDIFRLGDGYLTALGDERAQQVIPMALFNGSDITVAFSSDAPVVPSDPLAVIRSAIERTTPSGEVLGSEHSVSPMRAIWNYTVGGAYATHTDTDRGTLERGKLADFVALSADPATIPPQDFSSIRVMRTVVGGTETHSA